MVPAAANCAGRVSTSCVDLLAEGAGLLVEGAGLPSIGEIAGIGLGLTGLVCGTGFCLDVTMDIGRGASFGLEACLGLAVVPGFGTAVAPRV